MLRIMSLIVTGRFLIFSHAEVVYEKLLVDNDGAAITARSGG